MAGFPAVDGDIHAVISDGAGGWFIGGSFANVGGLPRARLARINADLSVHPWNPGPNNTVYCLHRSGSTVYIGGTPSHRMRSLTVIPTPRMAACSASASGTTNRMPVSTPT